MKQEDWDSPYYDHDPCDDCGSQFADHRCHMQEVPRG